MGKTHILQILLLIFSLSRPCRAFQTHSPFVSVPLRNTHGLLSPRTMVHPLMPSKASDGFRRVGLLFSETTRSTSLWLASPSSNEQLSSPPRHFWRRFWLSLQRKQAQWLSKFQNLPRRIATIALSLMLVFALFFGVAEASSGYRTGGSFKPSSSSRPPVQRHYSPSRPSSSYFRPSPMYYSPPSLTSVHFHSGPRVMYRNQPGLSLGNTLVLTGVGALVAYGLVQNSRHRNGGSGGDMTAGPLGYGATTTSVTVAVDISNRDDPNNLLNRLRLIAERSDTSRREGIQRLVSEASLEILRNSNSITSTFVDSKNHRNAELAQRDFNARSVESRSKYDRETVNRFGGRNEQGRISSDGSTPSSKATIGVITLNLAIDGSSTHIPSVKTRANLLESLKRIAADSQVEDCLFAAELLWTPAERDDVLTREELYYRYPNLLPV